MGQISQKNKTNIVIPECLCRESSDSAVFKVAGSPTQALFRAPALHPSGIRQSLFKISPGDFIGDDEIVYMQGTLIESKKIDILTRSFVFAVLLSGVVFTASAATVDSWIEKMNRAMHQQNYQGTLIVRKGDDLQALSVKQGISPEGSWQALESLTGDDQVIFRQNDSVTSIFPAKKLVTFSHATSSEAEKTPLHPALPDDLQELKKYYVLSLGAQSRIANKETQSVKMIPRDQHRYGYKFWLDKESGLLLKCNLLSKNGRVLEQIMYSNIELLSSAPSNKLDDARFSTFTKINLSDQSELPSKKWRANEVPAGFIKKRSVKMQDQSYHLVFSDGMASVSVFIEVNKTIEQPVIGQSSMGLVNAYSSYVNDTYITAMGEVPVSTVRMIAQSIESVDD